MFYQAPDLRKEEFKDRLKYKENMLVFGVDFLDHALRGICCDDLILLGAPSGVGKTQLCCNIALANMENGKKIHYIALEASRFEIERRLLYPLVAERFFADPNRPNLQSKLNYSDWYLGKFADELLQYELDAGEYFDKAYSDLGLFLKESKFGTEELISAVLYCSKNTDLIIIDHVHYFDYDDQNENRALKEIAKTVRTLAIEQRKPIILVAHLRKRDRQNEEICAGLDEFHGSSDLYKIATKVITFSPGRPTMDGNYETYFRIPKNRLDGGVSRFLGKEIFNPKRGIYEKNKYQIGWADQKKSAEFRLVDYNFEPEWFAGARSIGVSALRPPGEQSSSHKVGTRNVQRMHWQDRRD